LVVQRYGGRDCAQGEANKKNAFAGNGLGFQEKKVF
jgi:hypothetical protein